MVDPTKSVGPYQSLISGSRVSDSSTQNTKSTKDTSTPKDEVTLSPRALNVSQADKTASKLRSLLSGDKSLTLSRGGRFDESL